MIKRFKKRKKKLKILSTDVEEYKAKRAIEKAAKKRNSRKTPYPFGFEYKDRKK